MKITVLVDNLTKGQLAAEWGLSIHIDYQGNQILLDTGASDRFAQNAEALGIDLGAVRMGVLSHAHYDHANGMAAFFARNSTAPFYIREGTAENCYGIFRKYIGIRRGFLTEYSSRIIYAKDGMQLLPGVSLLAHHTGGLSEIGRKNHLYVRRYRQYLPDSFRHEQSLVFDTEKGLVVFNSCSHGGADNIIQEVLDAFPGKRLCAMIGGFHLFHNSPEEVRALAGRLRRIGSPKIYTGHCTGQAAFDILKEELDGQPEQLYTGMEIVI